MSENETMTDAAPAAEALTRQAERQGLVGHIRQYPERSDLRRRLCSLRLQDREHLTEEDIRMAFPEYPGALEIHLFLLSAYTNAMEDGETTHLELPTRLLHEKFPTCPQCLYFRAGVLFHTSRPQDAQKILASAQAVVEKYDYLANLYATVLNYNKQRDEAKTFIRKFFKTYDGDLWRSANFKEQQAHAIERQIPPILIITLPKSGSLFLQNTLAKGLSLPSTYLCPLGLYADMMVEERVRDFSAGGCIAVDHPRANADNLNTLHRYGIRRIVFHFRDVRQSVLSMVHHSVSEEIVSIPRERLFARRGGFDQQFESSYKLYFERWMDFLNGWVNCLENDDRFEMLTTNFNDLGSEKELFDRILSFYGIPREKFDWSILDSDKTMRAGHFRKGLKDEWRSVLSPQLQAEIGEKLEADPIMTRLERAVASRAARRHQGLEG